MKKILFLATLSSSVIIFAQNEEKYWGKVGINSLTPNATLEINLADINKDKTTNEGILIPRLTKSRVANIANNDLKEGTLIYIDDADVSATNTNTKVSQITENGFYHYDGENWIKGVVKDMTLLGDVIGKTNANTVTKIQGYPVSNSIPKKTQVLQWNGENWKASTPIRTVNNGISCTTSDDVGRRWATDKGILSCIGNEEFWYQGDYFLVKPKEIPIAGIARQIMLTPNTDFSHTHRFNAFSKMLNDAYKCVLVNASITSNSGQGWGITDEEMEYSNTMGALICEFDLRDNVFARDCGLQNIVYEGLVKIEWNYEIKRYDPGNE